MLAALSFVAAGTLAQPTQVDAGLAEPSEEELKPPAGTAAGPQQLRVGFVGSEPFVIAQDPPSGLSIDVWDHVAERVKQPFELTQVNSIRAGLSAVESGELDVMVGPISITSERARQVDFTQPYFQAEVGILAVEGSRGLWSRIAPFLTRMFAGASLVLALALFGIGAAMWLLERRHNPEQFPQAPAGGIANGVWFALVTMTTVGYGDRAPVTVGGRVLTGFWMLVALVTTSSLTAGIASAFTVLSLEHATVESAADMSGQNIAVVRGTTAAAFARDNGGRVLVFDGVDEAAAAAEAGNVVAVVHDRPMLRHYLTRKPDSSLRLAAAAYKPQGYGFAVAQDRVDLLRSLDVALLSVQEDGSLASVIDHWLGSPELD